MFLLAVIVQEFKVKGHSLYMDPLVMGKNGGLKNRRYRFCPRSNITGITDDFLSALLLAGS